MKLTSSRITWCCHSLLHLIKSAKIVSHVASSCRSSGAQTEFYWHHNKQITMPNASFNGGKGACNNDKTFRVLIKDLYFSRNSNKFTDCIYRTFIFFLEKGWCLVFRRTNCQQEYPETSLSLPPSPSMDPIIMFMCSHLGHVMHVNDTHLYYLFFRERFQSAFTVQHLFNAYDIYFFKKIIIYLLIIFNLCTH